MSDIYLFSRRIKRIQGFPSLEASIDSHLRITENEGDLSIFLTREQVAQMQTALALLYPEPPRPLFNATPTDEEREQRTCLVRYADEHAHETSEPQQMSPAARLIFDAANDANRAYVKQMRERAGGAA